MQVNKNTVGYIVIVALLIATSVLSLNLFLHERSQHDALDIRKFPMNVGEWKGKEIPVEEYVYQILETRNLITREYANPKGEKMSLFIIYSETNRSVFHPPEVCIIGSGIDITDKKTEEIRMGKEKFLTNKLYTEKDKYKGIVLYSYKAGKLYTENFYLQQTYLLMRQVFGKRVPGATIRVEMPIAGDEKKTVAILKDFLSKTTEIVDSLSK